MEHINIKNISHLANYLNIDKTVLEKIYEDGYESVESTDFRRIYSEKKDLMFILKKYKIPKKKGGHRIVFSPISDTLINCLKILNKKISALYNPPNCVHGFIKGRSIKSNASVHLSKNYIYKVDIERYFENINSEKITTTLIELGFTDKISEIISKIVTHNNSLIQGFHTSPTIANLIFKDLDVIFSAIRNNNIEYSRYADDLYFSSNNEFDIHDFVKKNLLKFGFTLNEDKTILMKRGQNQYVTGLTVFDSEHPRIAKRIKKKIRQEIYFIKKYGYKGHIMHKLKIRKKEYNSNEEIRKRVEFEVGELHIKINGWLIFINSIEPKFSEKYSKLLYDKPI